MKGSPAKEFMSRDLTAARADMLLTELVRLFAEKKVRGLPVTDEDGHLEGIITERDIFLKEKGVPFSLETVPSLLGEVVDKEDVDEVDRCQLVRVEEVMHKNVNAVDPETPLEDVAMLMFENNLTLVPVVTDDKLIGVVRRIHVLRKIYDVA